MAAAFTYNYLTVVGSGTLLALQQLPATLPLPPPSLPFCYLTVLALPACSPLPCPLFPTFFCRGSVHTYSLDVDPTTCSHRLPSQVGRNGAGTGRFCFVGATMCLPHLPHPGQRLPCCLAQPHLATASPRLLYPYPPVDVEHSLGDHFDRLALYIPTAFRALPHAANTYMPAGWFLASLLPLYRRLAVTPTPAACHVRCWTLTCCLYPQPAGIAPPAAQPCSDPHRSLYHTPV